MRGACFILFKEGVKKKEGSADAPFASFSVRGDLLVWSVLPSYLPPRDPRSASVVSNRRPEVTVAAADKDVDFVSGL